MNMIHGPKKSGLLRRMVSWFKPQKPQKFLPAPGRNPLPLDPLGRDELFFGKHDLAMREAVDNAFMQNELRSAYNAHQEGKLSRGDFENFFRYLEERVPEVTEEFSRALGAKEWKETAVEVRTDREYLHWEAPNARLHASVYNFFGFLSWLNPFNLPYLFYNKAVQAFISTTACCFNATDPPVQPVKIGFSPRVLGLPRYSENGTLGIQAKAATEIESNKELAEAREKELEKG